MHNEVVTFTLQEEYEDTKGGLSESVNKQHNGQKYKQRSTKHTHTTKDRVTRTPLTTGG